MPGTASPLLITPDRSQDEFIRVDPERAGWELLHFAARCIQPGHAWRSETGENELALVVLGGVCAVRSNRGDWSPLGRRPDVFHGMPYSLYLPRRTSFEVEALEEAAEVGYGWCATDQDHPPRLISPRDVRIEIRGGGNATRQINHILPPGSHVHRLVVCEVFTPSGNWSSYPPHKHDRHTLNDQGELVEADLEEVYYYKIDRPEGFAYQRVYTGDGRLDELVMAKDDDLVLVPEGYHPVVSAHGYTTYYLNMLAGSAQALTASDDPQYAWVKSEWTERDPRLPLVHLGMELD
jgi:5-deoxy-glucuronate isomerase